MNRLPTLKQLHHLVALFDYQHFGKAAEACFISQSTMSASIGHLEEILGVQLLERSYKTFIFTSLGASIVQKSRALIENAAELMDYAQNEGKSMHGVLRLGCIPTIAPFIMSALVSLCHEVYPALKLLIREDTTDNLLHSLEIGQIDTIILALPYPTKNLNTLTLCQDPFQLVIPANWRDKIEGKEMGFWPDECIFLLEKEHCLTGHTLQACALKNSKKINPFFATSLHTLTQMVIAGLGVTIFPDLAIKNGILTGSNLITIPLPGNAYREIGMAWRATSHKQDTYQLLADLVKTLIT
ncbi:hydrogen peroxide-inducible genes activator [Legionella yabuuchiae]|uniref:hydrogen peroxide-inducible genes activator n=1 Tax=Legionella yabuuchiae TaxID=376727 RepID=UPI00105588C8|nr:hydrogen peroxide-inducible genes activator [Legionella yabuuchiae]